MFTLASFDRTRSEIVEKTKPVIDRMLTLLPGWKKATYSVFFRDSTRRPETIELSVKQVKSAARLADLYQAMIGENLVEATLTNVISFDPNLGPQPGMFGFGMGTSVLTDREAERSPTLAMWVDTSSIDHQTVDLIRELWRNLLDDLMSANGNQAVIARANYTPSAAHPTAYEVACGCHHTLVTARQWVQRWVRVPGNDTLYLCSSIYEQLQLAEKDTIAKIATVRTLESSITKITLINAEDARSLEQALAAVLPSAEQSREASRNWYTPKTESS